MKQLFYNVNIVTMDENDQLEIRNGYLGIENDRISHVGQSKPDHDDTCELIDGKGKIVLPGLINTHGHASMSLLRGYGDDLPLQVWLQERIWPKEAQFTADHVRWGAALSVLEMIKGGTTTFADMYMFEDEVASVVAEAGMRASLSRGVIGLGSEQDAMDKLADSKRFAKEWNGKADGRITTMMAPPHVPQLGKW